MPLYPAQAKANTQINHWFENHPNQCHWLCGEMGSGKTYVASSVTHEFLQKHPQKTVVIVSPAGVTKKWQQVLREYNPNTEVKQLSKKDHELTTINIISQRQNYLLDELDKRKIGLLVYDEIHEVVYGKANFEHLEDFLIRPVRKDSYNDVIKYQPNILALTGTFYNQNIETLAHLLKLLNPEVFNYQSYNEISNNLRKINSFTMRYLQYISTTINLHELQKKQTELQQQIMPIKLIPLSKEEHLFYQLLKARYSQFKTPQKSAQIVSDYIDFPNKISTIKKSRRKIEEDSQIFYNLQLSNAIRTLDDDGFSKSVPEINRQIKYESPITLNEMSIEKSHKFQRLTKILKENSHETILVLLNGKQHLTQLRASLISTNRPVAALRKENNANKYEQQINNFLTDHDNGIFIADANQIKTGIDLNTVNIIVWYQLLPNLGDILQTQRRAQRLNSTRESQVYYLAYQETDQEQLMNDLSASTSNNAATYAARNTDALAQLKGVLFPSLTN